MKACSTRDIREVFRDNFKNCQSPSLRLMKLVQYPEQKDDKESCLKDFQSCYNDADVEIPKDENLSWMTTKDTKMLCLKNKSRLIVNLAGGVLENMGVCIHRNLGYPYIPGSAIKGVVRHYAWERWKELADGSAEKNKLAEQIAVNFGFPTGDNDHKKGLDDYLKREMGYCEASAGAIAFLDAVPLEKPNIEIDILACHHMNYYGGKQVEADDKESPNVQKFLTISAGTHFCFVLKKIRANADLTWVEGMLKKALAENGIGAKTTSGYGWFEEDSERAQKLNEKIEKEINRKKATEGVKNIELVEEILKKTGAKLKEFIKGELNEDEKQAFKDAFPAIEKVHKKALISLKDKHKKRVSEALGRDDWEKECEK